LLRQYKWEVTEDHRVRATITSRADWHSRCAAQVSPRPADKEANCEPISGQPVRIFITAKPPTSGKLLGLVERPYPTRVLVHESSFASRQVNREPLKVSQRTISQGTLVGGTQNHTGCLACFQGFLPTRRAKTPPITGFQAGKSKFLLRSGKVVTARFGIFEEFRCHHGTNRMDCPDPLPPYCSSRRDKTLS
jgi:hypothetical protein